MMRGWQTAIAFIAASLIFTHYSAAAPPNIVLILSDDQRHDTVMSPEVHTPNLDRLAAEGTRFTQAFIMGGTHPAVCAPSRAMLLTGRHLWRTPGHLREPWTAQGDDGAAEAPLLPQVFRDAGYATFGTGKWHNGQRSYARSFSDGGAIFFGGMADHLQTPVQDYDSMGAFPAADRRLGESFSTTMFTDAAVDFLNEHDGAQPFFLYVAYTAPHDPRTPPEAFANRYNRGDIEVPPNFLPRHPFDNGELEIRDEQLAPWPRTRERIRRELADYYGMITHMDAEIGRILDALEKSGRADNTIVVFASDNGLAVGQHGLLGKQNLYDHSVRVPMILRGPGIPVGNTVDALVYLHDLFPTLTDLAQLPTPDTVDTPSLVPLLQDADTAEQRQSVFAAYRDFQRMVRTDTHKLILYRVGDERHAQLFDLAQDPWETTNLYGAPEFDEIVAHLHDELAAWMQRADDPEADRFSPGGTRSRASAGDGDHEFSMTMTRTMTMTNRGP